MLRNELRDKRTERDNFESLGPREIQTGPRKLPSDAKFLKFDGNFGMDKDNGLGPAAIRVRYAIFPPTGLSNRLSSSEC